jgi:DNA invertase Pin-like site-specific DNA recombinase
MATIGYIRVSSNKQTLEHQRFEIENFAKNEGFTIDTWVEEKISSRKALKTRKLGALLENLQENDILISCEISRLGRSLLEVMRILETCLNKNCQVWTLKENYRLGNDIQSKVLAFAFGLAAEIERKLISDRTKSSLANIKAQGKKLGRPFTAESKKLKLSKNSKKIQKLLDKHLSKSEIARILGVGRGTLRRYLDRQSR